MAIHVDVCAYNFYNQQLNGYRPERGNPHFPYFLIIILFIKKICTVCSGSPNTHSSKISVDFVHYFLIYKRFCSTVG